MLKSSDWVSALSLLFAVPTLGQTTADITAEEALIQAEATYSLQVPDAECAPQKDDEIVVCAQEEEDQSQYRIKSSAALDPTSEEALQYATPRAPSVAGPGIFTGPPTLTFGPPPPPALIIDVTALPEAPDGSDADRIAKGEKPHD